MRNQPRAGKFLTLLCGSVLLLVTGGGAAAQEEGSKGIKAEEFIINRPKSAPSPIPVGKRATYKSSKRLSRAAPQGTTFAQLGLTIWRFRPSTPADRTKEIVVEGGDSPPTEWTPERVEGGTSLLPGQRMRLSIESLSRAGYLYVIDREQYADGSLGEAHLIYPTYRTRDENRVKAGKIVYIPASPRFFLIKPSESAKPHVGELVTILVSLTPLIDPAQLSSKPPVIERAQLQSWEKQWTAEPTKLEMEGGAGQVMTDKEQGNSPSVAPELTQDDPVPQTIYRVAIKPVNPLIITVPLRFSGLPGVEFDTVSDVQVENVIEGIHAGQIAFSVKNDTDKAVLYYAGAQRDLIFEITSGNQKPWEWRGPISRKMGLLRTLLKKFFETEAKEQTYTFIMGVYPEKDLRLAVAAAESPDWDVKKGRPRKGTTLAFVRNVMRDPSLYSELVEVFRLFEYRIRIGGIEHIFVKRFRELPKADQAQVKVKLADNARVPAWAETIFTLERGK